MAYVGMTAAQIRSTVRDITDLDEDDVPDSLLNMYIRDGYYRILDLEKRWPFLETTFTFQTRDGVRSYALDTLTTEPMSQIASLVDNSERGTRLAAVSYDEAEQTFAGANDVTGDPEYFAMWAGQIHIYPRPNTNVTLVARGYREPLDWQTEGGQVDASPSLHFPLVYYACSRIYQQLEDAVMADTYKRSFDEGVGLAARNIVKPNSHTPMVLSGSKTGNYSYRRWLQSHGRNWVV
jgi:hypothetical protein